MKGSIRRYCCCKHTDTGKQLGSRCPRLTSGKHGEWEFRERLDTTAGHHRELRRRGFQTKGAAEKFQRDIHELVDLGRGDDHSVKRVGDLIFEKTKRGGQLPAVEDLRRRLELGRELGQGETLAELLERWFKSKKALRESVKRLYRQHLDNYLIPHLGHAPVERLTAEYIDDLFDMLDEWNVEIELARAEKRRPVLQGDVRKRSGPVGAATQRRIFATLRTALNAAVRQRRIAYNPCAGVELAAEYREPARVWSPEQVATFLEAGVGPLAPLYRLVLLRGLRRGEVVGLRWADTDLDAKLARVTRPILQLGGRLVEGRPKTRAGERAISLDAGTVSLLRAHRTQQRARRLAWGGLYNDHDLVFAREDGTPIPPDYVSRHFGELAIEAGLPRIRLHEGRHTAATLALEAGIDIKLVSDQFGHSTTTITRDLYQHVRRALHDEAAEKVVALLPARKSSQRTGP
jgi:integrase